MWCEKSHSAKETQTRLFSPQGSSWCLYIKTPGLPSFGVSWWLILCFNQCFDLFLNIPKQFLAPEPISRGRRKPKQTPGPQWGANQDVLTDKPANDFCATFLTSQCRFYLSAKCYCYLRVADMTAAHACVHIMKICIWQGSIRLHGLRRRCLQINLQKRSHTSETDGLILVVSRNKECCYVYPESTYKVWWKNKQTWRAAALFLSFSFLLAFLDVCTDPRAHLLTTLAQAQVDF